MKIFYLEYNRKKFLSTSFKYLGNVKGKKREERFSKSTSQVDLKIFYLEYNRKKLIRSFKYLGNVKSKKREERFLKSIK